MSVDEDINYLVYFKGYETESHQFRHVVDYDKMFSVIGYDWSVVLIDNELPQLVMDRNSYELRPKLVQAPWGDQCILVIHDTEAWSFHADPSIWEPYKYKWTLKLPKLPWTTLASKGFDFMAALGLR